MMLILILMIIGMVCLNREEYFAKPAYKFVLIGMKDSDGADRQDGWYNNWDTNNSLSLMNLKYYVGTSVKTGNCTSTSGLNYMKNAGIFIIHTHGSQDSVKFTSSNGIVTNLTTTMLNALSSNALSDNELVIYGTCSAGKGGASATNIVNSTYNKGAKHVIGFKGITKVTQTNDFIHQFIHELGTDKETIGDAYDNALFWVRVWNWGSAGGIDDVLIKGSKSDKFR